MVRSQDTSIGKSNLPAGRMSKREHYGEAECAKTATGEITEREYVFNGTRKRTLISDLNT